MWVRQAVSRDPWSRGLWSEMDRLQQELGSLWTTVPAIRGLGRHAYPAVNVGSTEDAVDIFVFAPGLDPQRLDVQVERGVLSIAGERPSSVDGRDERVAVQVNERFAGRFRRVVNLPDDIDPDQVTARYEDGVLHVRVARRAASLPRRIEIQ